MKDTLETSSDSTQDWEQASYYQEEKKLSLSTGSPDAVFETAKSLMSATGTSGLKSFRETWSDVLHIDARIIDVRDQWVNLECLMDPDERRFQQRRFERSLLEGAVPLEVGGYLVVSRHKKPGKVVHTFRDGSKLVDREAFEKSSRFDDLADLDLEQPL